MPEGVADRARCDALPRWPRSIVGRPMTPDTRIYVAGHRGLAGSALVRALRRRGYTNIVARTHAELDLIDARAVAAFFEAETPEVVFLAAAKVGGILANNTYPAEFVRDNLAIQTNVIHEAWRAGVKRLLFLGSSCIYPRDCPQPIREDYLLTGPLEPTNRPYAIAKIAGIEMCWAYNRQYGTQYLCAMPTNLYGPGDNYDLATSHVLPALIRRFHEAKARGDNGVTLWGTGTPRREFLYSDDMARRVRAPDGAAARSGSRRWSTTAQPPLVNVGCGEDLHDPRARRAGPRDRRRRCRDRMGQLEAGRHAAEAARHRQAVRARLAPDDRIGRRHPARVRRLPGRGEALSCPL